MNEFIIKLKTLKVFHLEYFICLLAYIINNQYFFCNSK